MIEEFYSLHSKQDSEGWLKNQGDTWKALIYEEQGNYAEALSLYQSAYHSLQLDNAVYTYKKLNLARVLYKLGRNREAIAQLDPILQTQLYDSPSELLALIKCYVDCLDNSDRFMPKYEPLITLLADEFNTELTNDLSKLEHIKPAVERMVQENRAANKRYSSLVIQLSQTEKIDIKTNSLQEYISKERIACYRNLALEELKQLGN